MTANEVTSADGGWRVVFAFVAQWSAAAELGCWLTFFCYPIRAHACGGRLTFV